MSKLIPKISTIPLLQLASGDRLALQVYQFTGARPGKKVYLQANLHGAEIAGNAVIHQLIQFLMTLDSTQLVGQVWLVPVCNPLSANQRMHHYSSGRFNIYDGQDWNRIFWDYEKEHPDLMTFAKSQANLDLPTIRHNYLAQIRIAFHKLLDEIQAPSGVPFSDSYRYKLQSLCFDADYVIDLHTSTNQAVDYLYYFQNRQENARLFQFDYGILLDEYDGDAFDEAFIKPWLALEDCFRDLGRNICFDIEAWTLELGSGMQLNPESVSRGIRGIQNYLMAKGVLDLPQQVSHPSHPMITATKTQVKKYYATVGGMVQARAPLGTTIHPGEHLYQVLSFNKDEKLPTLINIYAEQSGIVYDVSTNQAVNEGEYILSLIPI
ncbi:succinylglutamate desuccinylase [Leptolyngbya sp. 'hensonii']|uniref:succinylglutamate desuccinylase/aspartoacylase domain-containing protein n=1 Tax=Leptolyngbya sp. 'hensonii' TaxID=1922337 RepID=UPI00094FA120|nr:succinylglutamate desuccinylase/aspartoacylase family protein [Leptolyngbya sp. 'hensonii']OLP19678.1 succinylglutamate desuccinylase [Leptolyngbya sp. 'hensonii']